MSLQYKVEVYIVKAIRRADFRESEPGTWHAILREFGLRATGATKDEAERHLLIMLAARVISDFQSGVALPIIDDVDINEGREIAGPPEPMVLTPQESIAVAEALLNPRPPTEYMLESIRRYREFVNR